MFGSTGVKSSGFREPFLRVLTHRPTSLRRRPRGSNLSNGRVIIYLFYVPLQSPVLRSGAVSRCFAPSPPPPPAYLPPSCLVLSARAPSFSLFTIPDAIFIT